MELKWCLQNVGHFDFNSLTGSDAYMCQYYIPTMVQIMACRLIGAKPSSEPMLPYCRLDTQESISVTFYLKFKSFHTRKCVRKCCLENSGQLVSASMCSAPLTISHHSPCNFLRHCVFHLQTSVHFNEIILSIFIQQEFYRPSVVITHMFG